MIVERLYTSKSEVELPMHSLEYDRAFSEVEENAIYYVAGYVLRKLIYRHQKSSDSRSKATVSALWKMLGEVVFCRIQNNGISKFLLLTIKAERI